MITHKQQQTHTHTGVWSDSEGVMEDRWRQRVGEARGREEGGREGEGRKREARAKSYTNKERQRWRDTNDCEKKRESLFQKNKHLGSVA